jgi:hypothetical protein
LFNFFHELIVDRLFGRIDIDAGSAVYDRIADLKAGFISIAAMLQKQEHPDEPRRLISISYTSLGRPCPWTESWQNLPLTALESCTARSTSSSVT